MDGWAGGQMIGRWLDGADGWMDGWPDGWPDGWIGAWVGEWVGEAAAQFRGYLRSVVLTPLNAPFPTGNQGNHCHGFLLS